MSDLPVLFDGRQQLPDGWELTTLGKLANYINGRAFKPTDWETTGRPIIRIQNLTGSTDTVNRFPGEVEPKYIIRDGDLLISWSATLGAFIYRGEEAVLNQHIFKVEPFVNKKFLFYLVKAYLDTLKRQVHGSGMQHITKGKFDSSPVPLPPHDEQKRIAEKLDTLLARVDSCQSHLERVPQILKRFRQSVLAAATSGHLTEDWRDEDNTSSRDFGDFEFSEFPASWNLLPIKEVGHVKGGKRLPNGEKLVDYDTGFPYIRAGQLKQGTVIAEGQLYLLPSTQKKISRYIVDAGDVYITIVGASIGDAGVIPQNYDKVNLTENAAKICQLSGVDGNYLALWLRSPHAQDIIQSLIKSGAQGKLALTRINEIPVPLPSLEEQAEIVRRVEKLFAYAERLEARYTSASEHVGRLTPSLLAKAFRGELVEQG